jgi:hypothetical protein
VTSDHVVFARSFVQREFPHARAAWLGGSAATGDMTATSDLDITVLVSEPKTPHRSSRLVDGWPVELFVQTEASLMRFCDQDRARRRPTTMRLVGTSIVLLDTDGSGQGLQHQLHQLDEAGPASAAPEDLETARYGVTELLDDLSGTATPTESITVAATLWREAGDLLLLGHRKWSGSSKWLVREIAALDAELGTRYADQLVEGLRTAATGHPEDLLVVVTTVLDLFGGRVFDGYQRRAPE